MDKLNYRAGSAGHIISSAILEIIDLPGMWTEHTVLIPYVFKALAKKGSLTRTADIRIAKVLRDMIKVGLLRKMRGGYVRA